MSAIDGLQKKIPGVRKTYDIACELAHPNASGVAPFVDDWVVFSTPDKKLIFKVQELEVNTEWGFDSISSSCFDTLLEVLRTYPNFESALVAVGQIKGKQAKKYLREVSRTIKKETGENLVASEYPCPCLRGRSFGNCCGRSLV